MTKPYQIDISEHTQYCLQSIRDSMYWFTEKLKEFQCSLATDPKALKAFSALERYPLDLQGELKAIELHLSKFECNLSKSRRMLQLEQRPDVAYYRSTEMPELEVNRLATINAQLEKITTQIGQSATEIAAVLDQRLANTSDCLWDYEMNAEISFVLREADPGFSEDSDNFLQQLTLHMREREDPAPGWEISGLDWPEGYESDPLPHGRLFHALKCDYGHQSILPPVNLKDILRIGGVWCDLIVRYQFYYDMTQEKWVKSFVWTEAERPDHTYVQEKGV